MRRLAGLAAFCAAVFLIEATSHGYVRTTRDGVTLYWSNACVDFYVNAQGSGDIDNGAEFTAVQRSLESWTDVDCSYFKFSYRGKTTSRFVGYNYEGENENLVLWQEAAADWTHARSVIALSTINYDLVTGEIADADIEMNGVAYAFTTSDTNVEVDIQNTITHELGHCLGLDHTPVSGASMYDKAPTGETAKRSLHQDDIDGICAIYPIEADPGGCGSTSNPEDNGGGGCAVGRSSGALSMHGILLLGLVLVLAGVGRWRSRICS